MKARTMLGRWAGLLAATMTATAILAQTPASQPASAPAVDHAALGDLLKKHVSKEGRVDYAAFKKDAATLDRYLTSLAELKAEKLSPDEQMALWINAYNACTIRLVLDRYPIKTVTDIPEEKRWRDKRWKVARQTVSLEQIENEQLRIAFGEPRVYFALNRGTCGDPPLRAQAYDARTLADQLEEQAQRLHRDAGLVHLDVQQRTVELPKVYDWHGGEFKRHEATVIPYVGGYLPELRKAVAAGQEFMVRWIDYDWRLNDIPAKEGERK